MATVLNHRDKSTVNAMWTLISQADANVQKELYIRLRNSRSEKSNSKRKHFDLDYIKSLAVGGGKVPAWEDGKGALADAKYNL